MPPPGYQLGVHVSTAGGVHKAPDRAAALGCPVFQFFASNPRIWATRPLDEAHIAYFRDRVAYLRLGLFFVHAPYLPNIGSPDNDVFERSAAVLTDTLARTAALGGGYVITHMGSHKGSGVEAGQRRAADAITRALRAAPGGDVAILMEDAARYSNQIGTTIPELAAVHELVGEDVRGRVGLCLDTCHAHVMGYDLSPGAGGLDRLVKEARTYFGKSAVKVLHLNDAAGPAGSRLDRHEHIGYGSIGKEGFRRVVNHPFFRDVPMILETPMEDGWDKRNLAAVRRLRAK